MFCNKFDENRTSGVKISGRFLIGALGRVYIKKVLKAPSARHYGTMFTIKKTPKLRRGDIMVEIKNGKGLRDNIRMSNRMNIL
jgi:hypothetical protein